MKKQLLIAWSVIPLLSLNACTVLSKPPTQKVEPSIEQTITERGNLLEFIDSFNKLSADNQKKELQQINQLRARHPTDITLKAHTAIIYSLPTSRMRDPAKAQILLDELLAEKSITNDQRYLLALLKDFSADNSKALAKAANDQKRADAMQLKADTTQQKLDALQKKLDDLKTIEKTMIDRDAGLPK